MIWHLLANLWRSLKRTTTGCKKKKKKRAQMFSRLLVLLWTISMMYNELWEQIYYFSQFRKNVGIIAGNVIGAYFPSPTENIRKQIFLNKKLSAPFHELCLYYQFNILGSTKCNLWVWCWLCSPARRCSTRSWRWWTTRTSCAPLSGSWSSWAATTPCPDPQ